MAAIMTSGCDLTGKITAAGLSIVFSMYLLIVDIGAYAIVDAPRSPILIASDDFGTSGGWPTAQTRRLKLMRDVINWIVLYQLQVSSETVIVGLRAQ
jgi:hypothetical protein